MKRLSLRILLSIVAGVSFAVLCFTSVRQSHVIDIPGWSHPAEDAFGWGEEPMDIGTPADVLLLAFNLPALIALLPLSPLAYWIQSEVALRSAWGLASVGQWFLIGRYFDVRSGLLAEREWGLKLPLKKTLFWGAVVAGALALGAGVYSVGAGYSSSWAFIQDATFVFWGIALLIVAFRWRSSSAWSEDRINSLGLS